MLRVGSLNACPFPMHSFNTLYAHIRTKPFNNISSSRNELESNTQTLHHRQEIICIHVAMHTSIAGATILLTLSCSHAHTSYLSLHSFHSLARPFLFLPFFINGQTNIDRFLWIWCSCDRFRSH